MKQLLVGLLVAMALIGCTDSRRSAADNSTGGSPQAAAPALALLATLPHTVVYAGDSLPVRVRLTSPRDRREAYLVARAREEGKVASVPSQRYVDRIPADWPDRLALTLVRVLPDGRRETVIAPGAWSQWRVMRDTKGASEIRIGDPVEEWRAPPEAAQLAAGRYVLEAQWNGTGAVDASWLGSEDSLRAPEITFEVRVPTSDAERAAHAERRAQEDFEAGRYQDARARGQEALRLDPTGALTPERIETYLVVARSSLALGDAASATDTYETLLRQLPPPEASDLAVAVEQWLGLLRNEVNRKP